MRSKSELVENYDWDPPKAVRSFEYIAPKILLILNRLGVQRVLDIGSGYGRLCNIMAGAGYQAAGVDINLKGIESSQAEYPGIPFYNIGVQDEPELLLENENLFDAVTSTEVVEHLFSPHLLLSFAKAVLREDGYLIVTTPYHGYIKNLALSVLNKWDSHHDPLWIGGHIKFWSRKTLVNLIRENDFDVIDFSGVGRIPYLWKSMVIVAKKRRLSRGTGENT